jgi:hypothetical protein
MARPDDEDAPWTRQLLVGLSVLAIVALVVGGVMSVVALGAAKVTGIADAEPDATQPPSLYIPSGEPTTRPDAFPDPPGAKQGKAAKKPADKPDGKRTKEPAKRLTLQAFPRQVSPDERINLTGAYKGGEGARLQVQRFEGRWVDFPVTTSVSGGVFSTYIFSGREGRNRFRVIDVGSGRASNAVRVRIG